MDINSIRHSLEAMILKLEELNSFIRLEIETVRQELWSIDGKLICLEMNAAHRGNDDIIRGILDFQRRQEEEADIEEENDDDVFHLDEEIILT